MPLILLFSTLLTSAFAVEIATFDVTKASSNELLLVTTDEVTQGLVEKQYMAQPCRPRINTNGNLREFYFQSACRADVTKVLISNGFTPDPYFRTFIKDKK